MNKREYVALIHCKIQNFIEFFSSNMDHIYKNIDEYKPGKKQKSVDRI